MMNKPEAIGLMLAGFPTNTATDPVAAARAYLLSVDDATDAGVEKAAMEYLRGEVPGHNLQYAPSTAEFAIRVRMHDKIGESVARRVRERPEALASLSEIERTYVQHRLKALEKPKK